MHTFSCTNVSSPLVSSVFLTSSPLVSSLVFQPSSVQKVTIFISLIKRSEVQSRAKSFSKPKRYWKQWSSWENGRKKYTRNEWKRCKTTLETSGEDSNYTLNEWRRRKNYTRNECVVPIAFRVNFRFPNLF
jgi:hypothetical protein